MKFQKILKLSVTSPHIPVFKAWKVSYKMLYYKMMKHIFITEQSIDKENTLEDEMSSPLKTALFWPKPIEKKNNGKSKEKVPPVATSQEWLKYQLYQDE